MIPPKEINFPCTKISGEVWILLKKMSDTWEIRASKIDRKRSEAPKDKNGHKVYKISAEGGVRFRPKKAWDITQLNM